MQNSSPALENNSTTEQALLPHHCGDATGLPTGVAIERALNLLEMRREVETVLAFPRLDLEGNG